MQVVLDSRHDAGGMPTGIAGEDGKPAAALDQRGEVGFAIFQPEGHQAPLRFRYRSPCARRPIAVIRSWPSPRPAQPDIILYDSVAAAKAMLVAQTFKDPFGAVPLLHRRNAIR